jgi:hypothetical protein
MCLGIVVRGVSLQVTCDVAARIAGGESFPAATNAGPPPPNPLPVPTSPAEPSTLSTLHLDFRAIPAHVVDPLCSQAPFIQRVVTVDLT